MYARSIFLSLLFQGLSQSLCQSAASMNQANAVPQIVLKVGDKVKIASSSPDILGGLYFPSTGGAEQHFEPRVRMSFNHTNNYTFTIVDVKKIEERRVSDPPTQIRYEYLLRRNLPTYAREVKVSGGIPKTTFYQANLVYQSGAPFNPNPPTKDRFKAGDFVLLKKDCKVIFSDGTKPQDLKVDQLLKIASTPQSNKGVYSPMTTTAGNVVYSCEIMNLSSVTGDTYWRSALYHPISALVKA